MSYQIVRNIGANGSWASPSVAVANPPGFKIVRLPSGPAGAPAAQDGGWLLTAPFGPGEQITSLPQGHTAVYGAIRVHTNSGVESPKSFVINQMRPGVGLIASTGFTLNPGDTDLDVTIGGGGLTEPPGDYNILIMPNPASTQLADLAVALVSVP